MASKKTSKSSTASKRTTTKKAPKTSTKKAAAAKTPARRTATKKSTPTKKSASKLERLIQTKSGRTPREVFETTRADLEPPNNPPTAEEGISIDVKITQEDIDAHLLLSMLDSNSGLLSSLHAMALEGKKWLQEEPEKANLFLSTAKKTTNYRPLKLLFEMMELDEEILKVPAPTEQGKKNVQGGFNSAVAFGTPLASLIKSLDQVGLDLNLNI